MKALIVACTILLALSAGCTPGQRTYVVADYTVEDKYCIQACVESQFKMFHSRGQSWGTGSSSMGGLSQKQIFDRVKQECLEFYAGETCCERPPNDYNDQVIRHKVHGYNYGPCTK